MCTDTPLPVSKEEENGAAWNGGGEIRDGFDFEAVSEEVEQEKEFREEMEQAFDELNSELEEEYDENAAENFDDEAEIAQVERAPKPQKSRKKAKKDTDDDADEPEKPKRQMTEQELEDAQDLEDMRKDFNLTGEAPEELLKKSKPPPPKGKMARMFAQAKKEAREQCRFHSSVIRAMRDKRKGTSDNVTEHELFGSPSEGSPCASPCASPRSPCASPSLHL